MQTTKGYKVTNPDGSCNPNGSNPIVYEVGKEYRVSGKLVICENGIHFCQKVADCFSYYSFDSENRVFEIEAYGDLVTDNGYQKNAASHIKVLRELTWGEMLDLANTGKGNTGINNAGNRNAGYYNAGNRNAGYANAGNDNAGVFNNTLKPAYVMFNKPSSWTYEDFVASKAFNLLQQINASLWVADYQMSEEEKKEYPYYVTTKGYVRQIPFKEAFQNAWHNWTKESREEFEKLPNFDAKIFEDITGVDITK